MNKLINILILFWYTGKLGVPESRVTNDIITHLEHCHYFVFGSNTGGKHGGGAARYAERHFGAVWGNATGFQGRSYAIPSLDREYKKLPLASIQMHVDILNRDAFLFPHKTFQVTEIGCGIAGFTPEEIAPLFKESIKHSNVILPEKFWDIIMN